MDTDGVIQLIILILCIILSAFFLRGDRLFHRQPGEDALS